MTNHIFKAVSLPVLLCVGAPVSAQPAAIPVAEAPVDARFQQFAPKADPIATKIDYTVWDEALKYFVFRMGKSIREGVPRPEPGLGTRQVYGHDSRYRLEGNRVIFSYLTDEIVTSLTEYREDLERTADLVDIQQLSRNEQLAYWMNLHNVAIIEQIAREYPLSQPSRLKVGDSGLPLDEAPFITVSGVRMSPRDIRTRIVYPNWKNPMVVYGFFRGDIGGPSIQTKAFTADNVADELEDSAREFVNSLRGVQKVGGRASVSEIYSEARPYYFPEWPTDLREHLRKYAEEEVTSILDRTDELRADVYEHDIADMSKGERDPSYGFVYSDGNLQGTRIPAAIARLLTEHTQKTRKLIRREGPRGRVIFIDIDLPGEEPKATEEVE